jgi:hypothetical protein
MYFATTPVPGYEREFSERFCILKKDKGTFDGIAGADPKKVVNVTIPLWNVKKIETTVLDETGIQDITFTMRYTNFTSPDKYYDDTDFATLDNKFQEEFGLKYPGEDAAAVEFVNPPLMTITAA